MRVLNVGLALYSLFTEPVHTARRAGAWLRRNQKRQWIVYLRGRKYYWEAMNGSAYLHNAYTSQQVATVQLSYERGSLGRYVCFVPSLTGLVRLDADSLEEGMWVVEAEFEAKDEIHPYGPSVTDAEGRYMNAVLAGCITERESGAMRDSWGASVAKIRVPDSMQSETVER